MSIESPDRIGMTADHTVAVPSAPQPATGLLGVFLVAVVFVGLGLVVEPLSSLQILGPVSTFLLPLLLMVSVWWAGWPGTRIGRPAGGLACTALVIAGGLVLTAFGQLLVGHADLNSLLETSTPAPPGAPPPPPGTELPFSAYPWTLPLAGAVFVAMLLLTFPCEQRLLRRLGPVVGGAVAVVVSWVIGLGAYLLLADWDGVVPPPVQGLLGLHNPGGPVGALDLLGAVLCVAAWVVVLFVALQGKPFAAIARPVPRLLVGNLVVIALGWLTFLLLHQALGLTVPEVAAGAGSTIGASAVAAVLFEGWPARLASSDIGAASGMLATVALLTVAGYFGLRALGEAFGSWNPRDPAELWVAVAALNYIAAGAFLWYGPWGRWPVDAPAPGNGPSAGP